MAQRIELRVVIAPPHTDDRLVWARRTGTGWTL